MRRILPLALLLAVLVGCGQSEEDKRAAEDARVAAAAREAKEAEDQERLDTADLCSDVVADFSTSLGEINSRLGVGMKLDEYNTALGDVKVAYDAADWDSAPNQYCLEEVGVPLEDAFKTYIEANTTWNDCVGDFNCDYEKSAQPKIQKKWTKAAELLEQSDAALDDFKLDSEISQ